jgi:hypothetical protein
VKNAVQTSLASLDGATEKVCMVRLVPQEGDHFAMKTWLPAGITEGKDAPTLGIPWLLTSSEFGIR